MNEKKSGFTLIELIVVIAILVLLILMLVPKLSGFTDTAAETVCHANTANAYKVMIARLTLNGGQLSNEDAEKEVVEDLGPLEKLCPNGGEVTVLGQNDSLSISCSKHGESALEILKNQAGAILSKAYDQYFKNNRTGYMDSTGPNFGMSIKKQLIEELKLKDNLFDFCVERRNDRSYAVYIFDALDDKTDGDAVSGLVYTFDKNQNLVGSEAGSSFAGAVYTKDVPGEKTQIKALNPSAIKK